MQNHMAALLRRISNNPSDVRFSDLERLCEAHFGPPRQGGTSHRVYRTPWPGDPRINLQIRKGKAKPYQVRQVLDAIRKKLDQPRKPL